MLYRPAQAPDIQLEHVMDNVKTPNSERTASTLQENSLQVNRGVTIPKHMVPFGEEGYRTPTLEDFENQERQPESRTSQHDKERQSRPGLSSPRGRSRLHSHINFHGNSYQSARIYGHELLEKLAWKERLRHFTWTFFTITMATGGIANVLYAVPFRFRGLDTIGTLFFLFNIVLFLINVVMISLRFRYHPETFKASFLHPTESLFFPASVVSFGTILINISQYGLFNVGSWLNSAVYVLFWIDAAFAIIASAGIYLLMWSTQTFTISNMTPVWIFPAYPLLIIGPHAGIISADLDSKRALDIIVGGWTLQGIGFMVSLTIYSAFIYRLMTQKLPQESLRPGMFVSVGPSAFTVAGTINMANNLQKTLPNDFMGDGPMTATILKVVADWMALWLWGFALWLFLVSAFAHVSCIGPGKLTFTMAWYSFVFPNTALITATFAVGKSFSSTAIQIVGCVMTCFLILVWLFVFVMMIRAIKLKQILWPQKGEDKDEGGWVDPKNRLRPDDGSPPSISV